MVCCRVLIDLGRFLSMSGHYVMLVETGRCGVGLSYDV